MDTPQLDDGRVEALLRSLTLEERCSLTAGRDMWSTRPVERVGIPLVRLTDGPNGARGPVLAGEGTLTSACVPSGSALGATWDPALIEEVGGLVGEETITKGCRFLLAPTVNLHRAPRAGRNFECYSEDPLLSGKMAAAFIRGAQSQGVACTVKHFVGNEAETARGVVSSEIDERTLRELYLTPFEIAVREGGVLAIMTAYNRLNGSWLTEHDLLRDVVRGEWGFDGVVMTDWGGFGSTGRSIEVGLDLEMPGPGRFFGEHLLAAVQRGDVKEADVDTCVRRLLTVLERIGGLDEPPGEPQAVDRPEHRTLARRAASAAAVLLRNEAVLPFDPASLRSIAVMGPNAAEPTLTGGGASNFKPHHRTSPLDALRARFPEVTVRYEPGSDRGSPPAVLPIPMHVRAGSEESDPVLQEVTFPDAQVFFSGGVPGTDRGRFHMRAEGTLRIEEDGLYTFGLVQMSPTLVELDGRLLVEGVSARPPKRLPWADQPLLVDVEVEAGEHRIVATCAGDERAATDFAAGFSLGCRVAVRDDAIERAVALAETSDVAIVVVGTDAGWETEAVDRKHMHLRGRQDEPVARVCAANPRTVVVLNTGAPVTMPWAEQAPALLQLWFAGQEIGDALVDVLVGDAEPGGRLPTTFPIRDEHGPAFGTFPGENGVLRYGEGVFVGYRWYASRDLPVLFPFGHGLSYTTFELGQPTVDGEQHDLTVTVPVTNAGARAGTEVVQLYVAPPRGERPRPALELRAFEKVALSPGASTDVVFRLDERAFARWDPALPGHDALRARFPEPMPVPGPGSGRWAIDPGTYSLLVGRSSADIAHRIPVDVVGDVAPARGPFDLALHTD